ncbi:hypothetical protein [Streptomyces sp. JJ36]|uniref:hypothetical protein n=1 Tax=Streptomyces sp. JJ36 TaxID=2736645 RepID=UPI001F31F798|nr:hypothetical protein [Streptomyces sp. JJ36]MCF6526399.1 hypothetical protein [Streptomyces sp. JJ36]
MTWDEWEQAKAGAGQPVGMQLNEVAPVGGGGTGGDGDLVVRDDELGALGNLAYDIHQRFSADSDHARQNTFDAATELTNDGLDMGSALTELHDAWNTKTGTLKEACAHISNHLDFSRAAHAQDEAEIVTSMRNAAGQEMTVSRIYDYIK